MDIENSMVIVGVCMCGEGWMEVDEDIKGINGDGKKKIKQKLQF